MQQDHPDAIRNDTDSKTMTRLIMINTRDSDFVILCNAIQTACKLISRSVRVAGIAQLCKSFFPSWGIPYMREIWLLPIIHDMFEAVSYRIFTVIYVYFLIFLTNLDGSAGSENATGDSQKKLDVLSNEMMVCRPVRVACLTFWTNRSILNSDDIIPQIIARSTLCIIHLCALS